MTNGFDFSQFMAAAAQPDAETRREVLVDAVSQEMDVVMGEVAPRIWCVLQEQMAKDPKNNIHLNAVLNSGIFAILAWMAACTPNTTDNDDMLREKIMLNLDNALKNARDTGGNMSYLAHNVGKLKLMEDALAGLSNVLVSNSMIIKAVAGHLKPRAGGGGETT